MTAVPDDTMDRLMTGSCEASCPNRYYGHSSPDPNTTTTTTQIETVMGSLRVQASDASAFNQVTEQKKKELFNMLVAHAAGSGVSSDMVSSLQSSNNAITTVDFTVTISNVDSTTVDAVTTSLKAMTAAKINDVMGMIFGECAGYTLTASRAVCMGSASECDGELSGARHQAAALALSSFAMMVQLA